jgi:tetratricopeptide (TPR) repeat protein
MSSEQARQFRDRGIALAKARRTAEARQALQQALRLDPHDETAWLYLASITEEVKERLVYLRKVLEINPQNALALKAVGVLGIDPEQLLSTTATSTISAVEETPAPRESEPQAESHIVDEIDEEIEDDLPELPDYLLGLDDDTTGDDDIPDYLRDLAEDAEDDEPSVTTRSSGAVDTSYLPDFDDGDDDDVFGDVDTFRQSVFGSGSQQPAFYDEAIEDDADDGFDEQATAPERLSLTSEARPRLIPPPRDQTRPGVPVPDDAYLNQVLVALPEIIAPHTQPQDSVSNIEWVHKEKNRLGERDIWVLRSQIGAGILAVLLVLGVAGWLAVTNVPQLRQVVFAATRSPTLTPSNTPTYTPGFTPTPSATLDTTQFPTYTPSATIPATFTPQGNLQVTPRPTELQLPVQPDRAVQDGARLINQGQYADAAATLAADRQSLGGTFNPNPYYFEAMALARAGEFRNALNIMTDAEAGLERVSSGDVNRYKPLVDLGFAEVYVEQAKDAIATGSSAEGNQLFTSAIERLQAAITGDPRLGRAYELLADTYTALGETSAAIDVVNAGQQFPELADNVAMILAKGRAYLAEARDFAAEGNTEAARAQYEAADHEAFVAAYLNPYSEQAYQLRIAAALERGQPGLAVLITDTYNLYYPNNPTMFRLRGDARLQEGNIDLAFAAYSQALESGEEVRALIDALAARGDLYVEQRRYDLALADFNQAYSAAPEDNTLHARRMQVAYLVGDYATVLDDTQALLGSGALPDTQIRLLRARALIDQAGRLTQRGETVANEDVYLEALGLLDQVPTGSLTPEEAAAADEYRAEAQLVLGDSTAALDAINRSLALQDSGTRRYLRARIYETLADNTDIENPLASAIRDYEWVVGWNTIFGFSFGDDARQRHANLHDTLASQATPEVTPET